MNDPPRPLRNELGDIEFELVLLCEHSTRIHICSEATYTFSRRRDWLSNIADYAVLVAKVLRATLTITNVTQTDAENDTLGHSFHAHLKFMEELRTFSRQTAPFQPTASLEPQRLSTQQQEAWRKYAPSSLNSGVAGAE